MVHITEEVPKEYLFDLEIPSIESLTATAVVTPEERVYRFRYKEDKETPLPILPSGSHGITATEAYIVTLRHEGIEVNDNKNPAPENFMRSGDVFPTPLHSHSYFVESILGARVVNYLLGGPN